MKEDNEVFEVKQNGEKDYVVTLKGKVASDKIFNTYDEAMEYIQSKPYELIAVLALAMCEVMYNQLKENEK